MIAAKINNIALEFGLIGFSMRLSVAFRKELAILSFVATEADVDARVAEFQEYLNRLSIKIACKIYVEVGNDVNNTAEFCEREEVSMYLIQWTDRNTKLLRVGLKSCRELRIPYLFYSSEFTGSDFSKVLVPVSFLEEDYEKTQFAVAFGRSYHSQLTILQANDYGSKAAGTVDKMSNMFNKFKLDFIVRKGKAGSFKLDKEAVGLAEKEDFKLVIVTASREYGLDDLLLGAKEYHLVRKSTVPLLLINPRGDLYALCD